MQGRVVSFDEHRGLGEIEGTDGRRHPFHCTAIEGDTRRIPVGSEVAFTLRAGHLGRWEAAEVTPR